MGIFEIISAIILIIACVFIVVVVLMKDTKTQMSQTISGATSDSYFGKNAGRTKEAMLNKATIVSAVVFFVLALAVNVINVYWGGSKDDSTSSTPTSSVVSTVSDTSSDTSTDSDSTSTSAE
ncbi:MAG: preprotein translocase subunit SecG [Lachnospiraceae bacterium]|nr:preprotein translocase subunit SecG [Ruminococcus sp.]MCM1274671.1 preprotein translocase subunit SecG [Lachnospiraceae bacterium]